MRRWGNLRMPSLLPAYSYDIFISYRQNDNRSDWVTEFVQTLQEELAAAIKDQVSAIDYCELEICPAIDRR